LTTLVYTELASQDLEALYTYIAESNPVRADSYVEELRAACRTLLAFSQRGRRRAELGEQVRSLSFRKQTIFYEIGHARIIILRVLSAGRDVDAEFDVD